MIIEVTQFIAPHGSQQKHYTEVPNDCAVGYESMKRHGCRLTAEVLSLPGRQVTLCIEHSEGDYDIELVKNGPEVQDAIAKMLRRFDGIAFEKWLKECA